MTINIPTLYASPLSIAIVSQAAAAGNDFATSLNPFQSPSLTFLGVFQNFLHFDFSKQTPPYMSILPAKCRNPSLTRTRYQSPKHLLINQSDKKQYNSGSKQIG